MEKLVFLVASDLSAVNQLIVQRLESQVPMIPRLAGHLIVSGGKRLRPALTLACALLCGYSGQRHLKLAACVELIHSATLLHDDVVDASALRRGEPSANAIFGNRASVLVGDFLFSRAFQLMVEDGSIEVLRVLANAAAVMAEGEVMQLEAVNNSSVSEQTYLEIARAKTAELFAAACRIGAMVADRPAAEAEALRAYGINLGMAYQIVDDVLDYSADNNGLGKSSGNDFREGKTTLPVILAVHRGSEAERLFWSRVLDERKQSEEDFLIAREILERRNALADSLDRAGHYGAIARDALGLFPDSRIKRALEETASLAAVREVKPASIHR